MANDTKVVTGEVRFSYVSVFDPKTNDDGKDVWSMLLLIPKEDKATLAKLKKAAEKALADGIANGKLKAGTSLRNAWKTLKDGDDRDDLEERPEYAGYYYMNVNAYRKPGVVDNKVRPILDTSEVYSGCYGRVSISAYPFNSKGNKGVTFGLENVQKLRDGDFLGGRSRAEDDFDAVDVDDSDDLFGDDEEEDSLI